MAYPQPYPALTLFQYPIDENLKIPNYYMKINLEQDSDLFKLNVNSEIPLTKLNTDRYSYKIYVPVRRDFNTYRIFLIINNDIQRPTLLANFRDHNIYMQVKYYSDFAFIKLYTLNNENILWHFDYRNAVLNLLDGIMYLKN